MEKESTQMYGKEDFIMLLEKKIVPGWWNKGAQKISYFIFSQLMEYSREATGKQEETVKKCFGVSGL